MRRKEQICFFEKKNSAPKMANKKKKINYKVTNDFYNFMQALPEQLRREKAARKKYDDKIKKRLYVRKNEGIQFRDRAKEKPVKTDEEIKALAEEKRLRKKNTRRKWKLEY